MRRGAPARPKLRPYSNGCLSIYYSAKVLVALFVLASFFILVVLLHYSTVISRLSEQNTALAQRLAILENRLEERETVRD